MRYWLTACASLLFVVAGCADDDPIEGVADPDRSFPLAAPQSPLAVDEWSEDGFAATSMAWLPDGRALVISKGGFGGPGTGVITLVDPDGTTVWDVGQVPVCTDAERGLLGIAVDPGYDANRAVYLYYTRQMNDCAINEPATAPVWNRVSRFTLADDGIDPASEEVLVDEIPGHQSSHNAGDLEFHPDGTLLVSTGEATIPGPDDPEALNGKILRLDLDAPDLIPADNPFADGVWPAGIVYATGLRNPFRIAVHPDGTIIAGDVGVDAFEEINLIEAGADYGWPRVEGPAVEDPSTPPVAWYRHVPECANAILGGDFVDPALVRGAEAPRLLAMADFGCGTITALELDDDGARRGFELTQVEGSLADVVSGPDGALYLLRVGPGDFPILRMSSG